MKLSYKFLFLFPFLLILTSLPAYADIAIPTETKVYFEQEEQAVDESVEYTVKCYGYTFWPGEEELADEYDPENPEEVYSYSANCPKYGCTINEGYYMNYRHIDYCDLEGEVANQKFTLENFSSSPMGSCKSDERDLERSCEIHFEIPANIKVTTKSNESFGAKSIYILGGIFAASIVLGILIKLIYKKK